MKMPAGRLVVAGLATVVVVIAVAVGLVVLGPPAEERARRLDVRRVQELTGIVRTTDVYWTRHGRLPSSLDELSREPGMTTSRDPVTAQPYDYRTLEETAYELCAVFERDSADQFQDGAGAFWSHGVGKRCFRLEAKQILR